jgi:hypothetical protein
MSKLSKQQIITNLIEIYGSDIKVRNYLIPQIKAEIAREEVMLGLPNKAVANLDFTFVNLPESQRTTEVYFQRLMEIYYSNKGNKWLREVYKSNITKLATTN